MRLQDRIAIITGAQQGIGRSIALAFARQGADLTLNYLDDKDGTETIVQEIESLGQKATAVQGNIADKNDVARLIATAEAWGGADLLVNNAGIFPRVEFLDMSDAEWDEVIDINLKGAFLCSRETAKAMVKHGRGGGIINISSVIATTGDAQGVHYTVSKSGLIGLTRACALALAPHRIRVNAIAPGVTDTAQPRYGMSEEEIAAMGASLPLGRITQPEEIADAAVFLASEEARQITGQTLHVNGGHIFG